VAEKLVPVQGGNKWYAKIKAEGGPSAVKSMECNGVQGARTDDAYFEFWDRNTGVGCNLDCSVVYTNGETGGGKVPPGMLNC
jgi:hypothetical protein